MFKKNLLKNPQLLPLSQPKTQATSEALMLSMFSSLLKQQKQTNRILLEMRKSGNKMAFEPEEEEENDSSKRQKQEKQELLLNLEGPRHQTQKADSIAYENQIKKEKSDLFFELEKQPPLKIPQQPLDDIKNILFRMEKLMIKNTEKHISNQSLDKKDQKNKVLVYSQPTKIHQKKQQELNLLKKPELKDAKIQEQKYQNKKNYSILSELLPYSDRRQIKIKIPFSEMIQTYTNKKRNIKDSLENLTQEWLGVVYRATASICWNNLSNNLLSFEETKILFTENIIYNFVEYMRTLKSMGYEKERFKMVESINETSCNILNFLCKQYPQTKNEDPNIALRSKIKHIDNKLNPQYDIVAKAALSKKISFQKNQNGNYASDIMKTINFMIQKTNYDFPTFQEQMESLFMEVFQPPEKRKNYHTKSLTDLNDKDKDYYEKVKKYTQFKIGRKISKNTMPFSRAEIDNSIFFVKSNSILRIITKWVEELSRIIKYPEQSLMTNEALISKSGSSLHLYNPIKKGILSEIYKRRSQLQQRLEKIKKQCFQLQVILTQESFAKENEATHLNEEQINVGIFCTNFKNAMGSYIYSELEEIIHFLLEIPEKIDISKLEIKQQNFMKLAKQHYSNINLVGLKIFDLLRCKCSSNESQIIYLLERLYERDNDPQDAFKIVRIKDRLNQGTRDILINAQIQNGLVCEIQLSVTSSIDKKQELLGNYEHFLYQLLRSKLGPVSQNAAIWSVLEQRSMYFQDIIQNQKNQKVVMNHPCIDNFLKSQTSNIKKFMRPMMCNSCKRFYEIPKTCLLNVKCLKCNYNFCGECHYAHLDADKRKQFIMERKFLIAFNPYLEEYTDFSKPFPQAGFLLRKEYLNKQLVYFKIIEKNGQNSAQNHKEIILVNSSIVNGVITNQTIFKRYFSTEKNGEHYFISKFDQKMLKNCIIFSIKNNLPKETGTWDQIQEKFKGSKLKYVSLLNTPNYLHSNVRVLKKSKDLEKYKNSLNQSIKKQTKITYLKVQKRVLLLQFDVQESILQKQITKTFNMQNLKKNVKDEVNSVVMQFKHLSDEMSLLPIQIDKNKFNNFSEKVLKIALSFNNIKDVQFLSSYGNIKILNVRQNSLTSLAGIEKLYNLEQLILISNRIDSLEHCRNLKKLSKIKGSNNLIKSLEPISQHQKLTILVLLKNKIEKIGDTSKWLQLEQLTVCDNPIKQLESINHLSRMQELSLGNTLINPTQLSEIGSFKKMKILSLQNLKIKKIDAVHLNFTLIQELIMSKNQIQEIENLKEMQQLVELDLSFNRITKINGLDECSKLKKLFLSNNLVTAIAGIKKLQNLQLLDVTSNPLQSCPDLLFKDLRTLEIRFTKKEEDSEIKPSEKFYQNYEEIFVQKATSSSGGSSQNNESSDQA